MTSPSNINIYDNHSSKDSVGIPTPPNNVRGWLMGVEGYRDSHFNNNGQQQQQKQQNENNIVNKDNNNNSNTNSSNILSNEYSLGKKQQRRPSISSIASEDSINLDDLIKANFTIDVDDEIDLPDLAGLDLDDSKEDFWKMDKDLPDYQSLVKQSPKDDHHHHHHHHNRNTNNASTIKDFDFIGSMKSNPELDSPELSWSPSDDQIETVSPIINTTTIGSTRHRSGSINSENSLNSYSTVTTATNNQYARYGMAPMIYQSDSTSTSSRTPSRLSNYSTSSQTSSNTTTGLPRPRKISSNSNGMPSPSRSITTSRQQGGGGGREGGREGREGGAEDSHQLLPRAHSRLGSHHHHNHHINHHHNSSNTGSATVTTRSKLAQRASHIPSPSSKSNMNNNNNNNNTKSLPRLTSIPSSRSTGLTGTRTASRLGDYNNNGNSNSNNTMTSSTAQRSLKSRASHIPSIYERSTSPTSSRQSSTSMVRNSLFGLRRDESTTSSSSSSSAAANNTNHLSVRSRTRSNDHRVTSPTSLKSSTIPSPSSIRSQSRIGIRKV